jgi:O-antigen/teichoic acid export membrane protein
VIQIGKKDLVWNYAATFLKVGSSALLLPLILNLIPTEDVGIWAIFVTVTSLAALLDLGFNTSFSRSVTYVFSGVQSLKVEGFDLTSGHSNAVNYSLLKDVIHAMRWFYSRMAAILFIIMVTFGTLYINNLLENYTGNRKAIFIAWALLCLVNTYNLYSLYYEALLLGKGLVKISKQIIITGQCMYLISAATLLLTGYGLIAIVVAQLISLLVVRVLSHRAFFSHELRTELRSAENTSKKAILQAIFPNALKVGLTSLGGFLVLRSSIVIGALYLTLEEIASYGITAQLISVISSVAAIYTTTYLPKIAHLRVKGDTSGIKHFYFGGLIIMVLTYLICGAGILIAGEWGLNLIGSRTPLVPKPILVVVLVVSLLESNHTLAAMVLLSKNEVPFFKASLISGITTVVLLLLLFNFGALSLWSVVLAPGVAQLVYQNWKWPLEVMKDLGVGRTDQNWFSHIQ